MNIYKFITSLICLCYISGNDGSSGKKGEGSSNGGGGDPKDVTDPDTDTCFYTKKEDHPYWSVDLGKMERVMRVIVTQCLDEASDKKTDGDTDGENKDEPSDAQPLKVVVTDLEHPPTDGNDLNDPKKYILCGETKFNKNGIPEAVTCPDGVDGTNVYVYLDEDDGVLALTSVTVVVDDSGILK